MRRAGPSEINLALAERLRHRTGCRSRAFPPLDYRQSLDVNRRLGAPMRSRWGKR